MMRDTSSAEEEMLAVVNGQVTAASSAVVPATDLGLLRGDGVFEVFQLYQGAPFALEEHLSRLMRSAASLDLVVDIQTLRDDIDRLLNAIPPVDGNVRLLVTRSGTRVLLQLPPLNPPARYRLALVPHLPTPLMVGVKSLSYALNCHALRLVESMGCNDALLYSPADHQILEGPFTAFAWVQNGELYTPPLSAGILDSITRRVLLDATDAKERMCTRENLERAEGACVMGTGLEVVPVAEIHEVQQFPDDSGVIREAANAVSKLIHARLARENAQRPQSVDHQQGE